MQSSTCQIQHLVSITDNSDHSLRGFMHLHVLAFNSHLFIILINTSNPLHLFNGFAIRTICLYTFWLWLHLIKLCKWIHVKSNTHTWHINSRLGNTSYIMLNWLKSSYKLITYLCILSWDRSTVQYSNVNKKWHITFSRRFYPKRLTIAVRLYIFISMCFPWESNPQPFALLTQCSTTEPHRNIT